MKKFIFLLVTFCSINAVSGQFYISASGGYAIGSAEMKLGEIITATATENSYGSYGEGFNFQLKGGYFFNKTFGVELGFGYLHGTDQTVTEINIPEYGMDAKAIARGRAFGFTPAVVYKFTDNLYGRFGALLKLGGKTEAVVNSRMPISPDNLGELPLGSYTVVNYTEDYHGVLPLGFVGAFGYKHNFSDGISMFAEFEYMGISVKRNDSEIAVLEGGVYLPNGTQVVEYNLDNLPPGFSTTTEYVDEIPNNNTDPSIELSQKVPYSSFGINIGITYTFSKKEKK